MDAIETPTRRVFRGKLTGFRVFLSCLLGCWLGFTPGFVMLDNIGEGLAQAPALILAILAVALIFRSSVVLFVLTVAGAKALAIVSIDFALTVGRLILDGPIGELFAPLINGPFTHWAGTQYYATTGGLAIGTVVAIVWSALVSRLLKKTVPEEVAAERRVGMPIRLSGVIAAVVIVGIGYGFQEFFASQAFKKMAKELETGNGATVDVADLKIDLAAGEIVFSGLAAADSTKLDRDVFRAGTLRLQIDTTDLAAGRIVISNVTAETAKSDVKRAEPGKRIGTDEPPVVKPKEGEMTLEDYLAEAGLWEQRLRQANDWIEMLFRSPDDETGEDRDTRVAREVATKGPAWAVARHLVRGAPLVLVEKITITDIALGDDGLDKIDILAHNLSTNPSLVDAPASLSIQSQKKTFGLTLGLTGKTGGTKAELFHNALPVDAIMAKLKKGKQRVQGGTLAVSLGGDLQFKKEGMWLDLPLNIALQGTTLHLHGVKPTKLDKLELPLGLKGPVSSPSIRFDESKFADALIAAGQELANRVRNEADKLLGDKVPDSLKGAAADLLSGKGTDSLKKAAEKAAADAAAKATEEAKKKAEDKLQKKAGDLLKKNLGGLLGGKKK